MLYILDPRPLNRITVCDEVVSIYPSIINSERFRLCIKFNKYSYECKVIKIKLMNLFWQSLSARKLFQIKNTLSLSHYCTIDTAFPAASSKSSANVTSIPLSAISA
mmetsp:Transcript_1676/g.2043  ORF Transcript_1676/g.2043 Transcript_1676/m.2043 type:complete len:106 (+) Transcript_1676:45-362(+)